MCTVQRAEKGQPLHFKGLHSSLGQHGFWIKQYEWMSRGLSWEDSFHINYSSGWFIPAVAVSINSKPARKEGAFGRNIAGLNTLVLLVLVTCSLVCSCWHYDFLCQQQLHCLKFSQTCLFCLIQYYIDISFRQPCISKYRNSKLLTSPPKHHHTTDCLGEVLLPASVSWSPPASGTLYTATERSVGPVQLLENWRTSSHLLE